jgi:uncharacterized membrane protein (DUF2068 family)
VRREPGLVVIIAYKFAKSGLWLVAAVAIVVASRLGLSQNLLRVAQSMRHHSGAWSLRLADLLASAASRRGLSTLVTVLVADGTLTLVEGWALLRGKRWGPWLVVAATGALLPFEVVAIARAPHLSRVILLLVNAAIVAYLVRKAQRDRRDQPSATRPVEGHRA